MTTSRSDPRSVLLIGGTGFVGAAVLRHLLTTGWRVTVFGPAGPLPVPKAARHVAGSIEDAGALRAVLAETRPAAIASFAAYAAGSGGLARAGEAEPERAIAVNVLGFRRLLEAAAHAGIGRVIWTSSTVVYGPAPDLGTRLAEDAPRRPANIYGLTKVMAEEIAAFMRRRHGIEIAGLRIPLMLGPGLWYEGAAAPVKRLVAEARPGARPRVAVSPHPFDAMHVADLGRLVEALLAGPAPRHDLYNVAGFTTSFAAIAAALQEMVPGYAPSLATAEPPVLYPLVTDARLRAETGFATARDLRATLRDMLAERDATGGTP